MVEGLLFALLWASATVATKFAIKSADLFLLTFIRFSIVAILLQSYRLLKKSQYPLPAKKDFGSLFILGLLNITIYMSGFLIAIQTVSAGMVSLVSASNPLILILLSSFILKRKLLLNEIIGIIISLSGLILATIPNLHDNHSTIIGLIALIIGNISLSLGSIYYSKSQISLPKISVNTWQITFGSILFIPIILINSSNNFIVPDLNFYLSLSWLVIPVSIIAYTLWLRLLDKDSIKAGIWLFLTPVLGYLMAIVILNEPITIYGIAGAILVVSGLLFTRKKTEK